MCVYPLMLPTSSLSISPPPRGPGPYACLDCERGHTGQDPAKPRWDTRLRVLKCVRASICYD